MRDPRVDPKRGDVLKREGTVMLVTRIDCGTAHWAFANLGNAGCGASFAPLSEWPNRMKNAEVIHAAD